MKAIKLFSFSNLSFSESTIYWGIYVNIFGNLNGNEEFIIIKIEFAKKDKNKKSLDKKRSGITIFIFFPLVIK